ncbi:acyl carrier protein [Paenibacillus sambharensis]|uniref:Acyl carrier protein n=1 Tax=Paenibacillus sambharensis TaxID=1803190 RepID=A0A2W1LCD0_9BACL|nr:phosphopantetheine-binding protein [Paenibacillus sambharensis]PZD96816.1 acyl carrier protein [Paenibacillus sambharensis]
MENQAAIEDKILQSLRNVVNHVEFDKSSPLLELGIDSMTFIRLVVEIEEEFSIEIQDEDIVLDNFSYVENITNLVIRYLSVPKAE